MGLAKKPRQSPSKPHQHYEFFGPHGPAVLTLALPAVIYGLVYGCNAGGCLKLYPQFSVPGWPPGTPLYTHSAMAAYLAWFFGLTALHLILPGRKVQGVALQDGSRLTYRLNGECTPHAGPLCSQGGGTG